MGIYILFEKTQLSEAFIVRSLSQRGIKKQETNFTSLSQDDLLAWHKRYLLKYLNYLGLGSSLHAIGVDFSQVGTPQEWDQPGRVATGEQQKELPTAERKTPHPLCPPAIQPTPLRFVKPHQLKPCIFLSRQGMQELMSLLPAHPALALVALPAVPSSTQRSAWVHLGPGCISPAPTLPRAHIIPWFSFLLVANNQFLLSPKKQQLCFQRWRLWPCL